MTTKKLLLLGLAGIVGLAGATSARAAELRPIQSSFATLGQVTVITYYIPGPQGFNLVATAQVGEDDSAVPLRFTATLAPGQRVVISVPGAMGAPSKAIQFERIGDRLEVRQAPTDNIAELVR